VAEQLHDAPDVSLTELVSGILDDSQRLLKQQLDLLRAEIRADLKKTREGISFLSAGVGVCALAVILLALASVHLLAWLAPGLPLWACYAISGGVLAAAGAGLVVAGIHIFGSFNPLPEQSVQALEENVKCLTNTSPK
jgi:Putative Actinobacterial Holin-X, holin superfamily III